MELARITIRRTRVTIHAPRALAQGGRLAGEARYLRHLHQSETRKSVNALRDIQGGGLVLQGDPTDPKPFNNPMCQSQWNPDGIA
jgi:hypothetical protein